MSTLQAKVRGTKRKCQDAECGRPFYDLNRTTFACPICGTEFDLQAAILAQQAAQTRGTRKIGRLFQNSAALAKPKAPIDAIDPSEAIDPIDGDDLEVEVEAAEDENSEIANVEPILEDDDPADVVLDIDPAPEKNLDE